MAISKIDEYIKKRSEKSLEFKKMIETENVKITKELKKGDKH